VHYLHGILVEFDFDKEVFKKEHFLSEEIDSLKKMARRRAIDAIEQYQDQVFDWLDEYTAGRWEEKYPGNGVILGLTDPELFLKELEHFRELPLKRALEWLGLLNHEDLKWRTLQEYQEDPDLERVPPGWEDFLLSKEDPPKIFSGYPKDPIKIDENFIRNLWASDYSSKGYYLYKTIALANGYYECDSGFYSIPDADSKLSSETLKRIRKNPENFALVMVDMHF